MKYTTRRAVGLGLTGLTALAAFFIVGMLALILLNIARNGARHLSWTFLTQPPATA